MAAFKSPGEIKVGVIGYGGRFNMGRKHLQEMRRAGMVPAAVTEIDPARLEVATEDFPGIETYDDVKKMLKGSDVNLITIITPHNTHARLATACLKAGRHVVCEKPFAITTAECDRMIRAAEKAGRMISTYHNRHWDGCVLSAIQKIKQKQAIGELFKVECHMGGYGRPGKTWRASKSVSGGIMYDWGVHLLEYALQLIDSELVEVSGFAHTGFWESQVGKDHPWKGDLNEDEGNAIARFENGTLLHLSMSSIRVSKKPGTVEFFGTEGSLIIDHHEHTTITPKKTGGVSTRTAKNVKGQQHRYYQNVADYLTGKAELIITPQWARRPIHILDLADRSAKANRTMKAKYG